METVIIVAVITIIPTILLIIFQSRGRTAEAAKNISDSYKSLLDTLKEEMKRLSEKIECLELEYEANKKELKDLQIFTDNLNTVLKSYVNINGDLREGIIILREQVTELGGIPKYDLPQEIVFDFKNKE